MRSVIRDGVRRSIAIISSLRMLVLLRLSFRMEHPDRERKARNAVCGHVKSLSVLIKIHRSAGSVRRSKRGSIVLSIESVRLIRRWWISGVTGV
jgi:hypothetical protein